MKKILFIEDEQTLQKTFEDVLENKGYKIIHALTGDIGLRLAKKEKPDLILLDLLLPKISGLEVLAELKRDPETKKIPVIILTQIDNPFEIDRALALGATTYLVKTSYTLDEVLKKIEKSLEDSSVK
jgi:DNA-binding response OmpR family regulator